MTKTDFPCWDLKNYMHITKCCWGVCRVYNKANLIMFLCSLVLVPSFKYVSFDLNLFDNLNITLTIMPFCIDAFSLNQPI